MNTLDTANYKRHRVLLMGATGFVGRHLYPALLEAGHSVLCASRRPKQAAERFEEREWVELDLDQPKSVESAVAQVDSAIYLVHHLNTGPGYVEREEAAARSFVRSARESGLERIVYLGGVEPDGPMSLHLRGRLSTGQILREGATPALELRAGMIIGPGSASWNMVEDLAARLPAMVLPAWLRFRSQPISIDDVVFALTAALSREDIEPGWYNIPGPETVTHAKMLRLAADVLGKNPVMFPVPILSPFLSSYWIAAVTRTPLGLAREIVQGLQADLLGDHRNFFDLLPEHRRMGIAEAMAQALADEAMDYPVPSASERLKSSVRSLVPHVA